MKKTSASKVGLILAPVFLLGACQSLPTYPINARARRLAISEADRIALDVALVISEPMACRLFLDRRIARSSGETFRSSSRELSGAEGTDQYYPIRREFARVAEATFRQVFTEVALVKQLPPPGRHGAVVQIDLLEARIMEVAVFGGKRGRTHADVVLSWKMEVFDGGNVRIAEERGQTAPRGGVAAAEEGLGSAAEMVGEATAEQLSELAKVLALKTAALPPVRALAAGGRSR